jgi:hypothetical protein
LRSMEQHLEKKKAAFQSNAGGGATCLNDLA